MRTNSFSTVYNPEDEHMAAFKKTVQQEIKISRDLAKLKGIILSQFRREGTSYKNVSPFSEKGRQALLEAVSNDRVRGLILQNYRRVEYLKQEKSVIRKMVKTFFSDIPVLQRILNVPGVGPVSAARFVAYVQTPFRFSSKRKLWRYSRLGIVNRSSDGKPLGRKRLDRCAGGMLKDVSRKVFNAAMSCRKDNMFKRSYCQSLARTENPVHARLSTQRKVLSVLRAMWRDNTEYKDNTDRA
jgi:transposase